METLTYRAFATELTKIALVDYEVRAKRAEKKGEEYLYGGRIKDNSVEETNFVPKIAAPKGKGNLKQDKGEDVYGGAYKTASNKASIHVGNLKQDKKDKSPYETARNTALTGMSGMFAGPAFIKLRESIRGGDFKAPGKHHAIAAGLGAGVALADRAYRHRTGQDLTKQAAFSSQTFSPGRQLRAGQETRRFHDTDVHTTAKPQPPGLGAAKFHLPLRRD